MSDLSGTGKVRMSPPFAYITNLSIVVEVLEQKLRKEYFYYYLRNDNLRQLDSGSAQSQITTGDLGFRYSMIPTLNIQKIFAENINSIWEYSMNLDNEIEKSIQLKSLILSKSAYAFIRLTLESTINRNV